MATLSQEGTTARPGAEYTARLPLPDVIVRGRVNTLRCPLYRDGVLVEPTLATFSLYNPAGTAVIDAEVASVVDGVLEYDVTVAEVPATTALGVGWRVEWAITVAHDNPDGVIQVRNDAILSRSMLSPVITDGDLEQRLRGINQAGRAPIVTGTSQPAIDEAWIELNHRLINQGNRPNLIISPSALRMPHLFLALAIRLDGLGPAFAEQAASYRRQYESAWNQMTLVYDEGDDGEADSDTERMSGSSSVWLG